MFRDPTCSTFRKIFVASVFGVGVFLIPHGVQSATSNSATLQWAPNQESDLAGYRVYHGTTSGNYGIPQNTGMTPSYQYTDLEPNKTHYFSVTAYDTSGNESPPSSEISKSFSTLPNVLLVTLNGDGTIMSSPAGLSCPGECAETYPGGTVVTLTAMPNPGSVFSGWSGEMDCSDGQVTLDAAKNCTANFILGGSLLIDDFADGNFSGWNIVDQGGLSGPSAWVIVNGRLVDSSNIASSPGGAGTAPAELPKLGSYVWYENGESWTDYVVTIPLRSTDDDTMGVMMRYQDQNTYYRFSWDKSRSYRRLTKQQDGEWTLLAEDNVPYITNQLYHVMVRMKGATIEVQVDGVSLFGGPVTDGRKPILSGSVGLYTYSNATSEFEAVVVDSLSGVESLQPLTVSIVGDGSGTISSNPIGISCSRGTCSDTFSQESSVTLTAAPSGGSTFSGWSGACSGIGACVVAPSTSSTSVSATFASSPPPSRSLSVTLTGDGKGSVMSNPSGLTCSQGTCAASFPEGTTVTLIPATESDTVFEGWNGVCSGTSNCAVTLSSSKAVMATFVTEHSDPSPPTANLPILVNFQPPASQIPENFKKDDGSVFASPRGYGWNQVLNGTEQNSIAEQTLDTFVSVSNQRPATWNFAIPNGVYYVTMVLGDPAQAQGPHWVSVEDLQLAEQVKTDKGEYLTIVDYSIEVKDSTLSLTLGKSGQGQTTLNYIVINEKNNLPHTSQTLVQSFGTTLVNSVLNPGEVTKINPVVLVQKEQEAAAVAQAQVKKQKEQEAAAVAQAQVKKQKEQEAAAVAQAQVKKQKEQEAAAVAQAQVKKQKEQEAAAVAQAQVKKQKEQEAAAVARAQLKKQKEREVATLNGIKEKMVSARKSGGTVSLRNLFGR